MFELTFGKFLWPERHFRQHKWRSYQARPTGLLVNILFVIIVFSWMELQQHYLLDIQSSAIYLTIYLPRCEILVMSKYTSSSVNLFTSMLSQSCLNIHTGGTSRTCTYISMFMLLSVFCQSLRTVQTDSIIYKYCYLWLILILNETSQVL